MEKSAKFSQMLTVRLNELDSPPPPTPFGQPDRKICVFFLQIPLNHCNGLTMDVDLRSVQYSSQKLSPEDDFCKFPLLYPLLHQKRVVRNHCFSTNKKILFCINKLLYKTLGPKRKVKKWQIMAI